MMNMIILAITIVVAQITAAAMLFWLITRPRILKWYMKKMMTISEEMMELED